MLAVILKPPYELIKSFYLEILLFWGLYSHFVLKSFAGRQNNSKGPHEARYSQV